MTRPKKSDNTKISEGTFRDDRAQSKQDKIEGELTSHDFAFRTPNSTYKLLVEISKETGTHSKQYCISLRMLAVNLYQWAKLYRDVDKEGFTYTTKGSNDAKGELIKKVNPDAEQMDKAFKRVMAGLKSHGFDPASAASVSVDEADGKNQLFDALSELMGGGNLEPEFDN